MVFDKLKEEIIQELNNKTALGISLIASLFVSIILIAFQLINAGIRCYFHLTKENVVYFIFDAGLLVLLIYWINWSVQVYLYSNDAIRRIRR